MEVVVVVVVVVVAVAVAVVVWDAGVLDVLCFGRMRR